MKWNPDPRQTDSCSRRQTPVNELNSRWQAAEQICRSNVRTGMRRPQGALEATNVDEQRKQNWLPTYDLIAIWQRSAMKYCDKRRAATTSWQVQLSRRYADLKITSVYWKQTSNDDHYT